MRKTPDVQRMFPPKDILPSPSPFLRRTVELTIPARFFPLFRRQSLFYYSDEYCGSLLRTCPDRKLSPPRPENSSRPVLVTNSPPSRRLHLQEVCALSSVHDAIQGRSGPPFPSIRVEGPIRRRKKEQGAPPDGSAKRSQFLERSFLSLPGLRKPSFRQFTIRQTTGGS